MTTIGNTNNQLKILYLINSMSAGGAESLIYNWASYIKSSSVLSKEISIEICTLSAPGHFGNKLIKQGIPVHSLGLSSVYDPWAVIRITKFLDGANYDIIHVHLFPSSLFASLASLKFKKLCWIFTEHSVWNRRRQWKWFKPIDRFIYSRYVQILAVSTPVQDSLIAWLPEFTAKTQVLPNAVNINQFVISVTTRNAKRQELGIRPEQTVLLFIGRLTEAKGVDVLLRALSGAEEWEENCVLLIVGEGSQKKYLENLGQSLGLVRKVRFLGVCEDIPELLAAADVFVLPSRWEGLPMVILEAMAAGKLIIATTVGGIPEVIEDGKTGLLVRAEDVESLRNVLESVVADVSLREKLGVAAKNRVKQLFSIETRMRQLISIYNDILQQ